MADAICLYGMFLFHWLRIAMTRETGKVGQLNEGDIWKANASDYDPVVGSLSKPNVSEWDKPLSDAEAVVLMSGPNPVVGSLSKPNVSEWDKPLSDAEAVVLMSGPSKTTIAVILTCAGLLALLTLALFAAWYYKQRTANRRRTVPQPTPDHQTAAESQHHQSTVESQEDASNIEEETENL